MPGQQSADHHYVPIFYLSRWTGPDGKVCEFSRPHHDVKAIRRPPKGAGFQRHLYTVEAKRDARLTVLEDVFLKRVDQEAADALDAMLANMDGSKLLSGKHRSGWSRFLMSLMHRSPAQLRALKERCRLAMEGELEKLEAHYGQFREADDPETYEEMRAALAHDLDHKSWAMLFEGLVDNQNVGSFINAMDWSIVRAIKPPAPLLTSDRPLCMSNGLDKADGQIILPVSPDTMFVAVNSPEMKQVLVQADPHELVAKVNDRVSRQATRFVYGPDDSQAAFVAERMCPKVLPAEGWQ